MPSSLLDLLTLWNDSIFWNWFLIVETMWQAVISGRRSSAILIHVSPFELRYRFSLIFFSHIFTVMNRAGLENARDKTGFSYLRELLAEVTVPGPLVEFLSSFTTIRDPTTSALIAPNIPPISYAHNSGLLSIKLAIRLSCVPAIPRSLQHRVANRAYNTNLNDGATAALPAGIISVSHEMGRLNQKLLQKIIG